MQREARTAATGVEAGGSDDPGAAVALGEDLVSGGREFRALQIAYLHSLAAGGTCWAATSPHDSDTPARHCGIPRARLPRRWRDR